MAEYVRIITSAGATQYRNKTENKIVGAAQLEESLPALKEELDIAEPGTVIDSDTITQGSGDGVVDDDADTKEDDTPAPEDEKTDTDSDEDKADEAQDRRDRSRNPFNTKVPQTEDGFGFPRKNGVTVDIFDGETPHTHVRLVAGMAVPVSEASYRSKTDSEIWDKLDELELV